MVFIHSIMDNNDGSVMPVSQGKEWLKTRMSKPSTCYASTPFVSALLAIMVPADAYKMASQALGIHLTLQCRRIEAGQTN